MKHSSLSGCLYSQPNRYIFGTGSDQDILRLQDLFLSPGYHTIAVDSFAQGRELMGRMLPALHYDSSRVAALSLTDSFSVPVVCLYDDLLVVSALSSYERLTSFLLDQFNYDFLWIECTNELARAPWYELFDRVFDELGFANSIPVVSVLYSGHRS